MSITKAEKETIILFDEADASAEIYTHNTKLKNRLARAASKHKVGEPFSSAAGTISQV